MNIIRDSRPLEPLPVVTEDNLVTGWYPQRDEDLLTWYDWIASTGLRALLVERGNKRAVYRIPAAVVVKE